MQDGHSDGHHGAIGVDGAHGGDHHADYVAVASASSVAAFVANYAADCVGGAAFSADGAAHEVSGFSGAVHSHEGGIVHAHHAGVPYSHHADLYHSDAHLQHLERAALQSAALDPSPDGPPIFNTPTHKPDGEVIRSYVAYVDRHGQFDVMCELSRIAPKFGLIWLDSFRPNFDEFDHTSYKILDRDAWLHYRAEEEGIVANEVYCACQREAAPGWYEGATGLTRLRRQHWHIGRVKGLLGMGIYGNPEYDPNAHAYLEIEPIEWSFYEAGDFSTAVVIRIVSLLELDDTSGQFGYRRESFIRHQRVAIRLFEHMLAKLLLAKKTDAQLRLRENVDRKSALACKPKQSAKPVAAPVSGQEGEKADLVIYLDD